jgi:acetyl esterase/lipase
VIAAYLAESGLSSSSIAEQRAAMAEMAGASPPMEGVTVEAITLGGRPAERLTPEAGATDAAVLYLHGGGYCIGSLDSHRGLGSRLAMATGCTVAMLDYRLAPEHPFPAAVDDAVGAYRDLLSLGFRPERMAIAGDSAGGGLTVATLLALRGSGEPLPGAAVCLSPWADLTQSSTAYRNLADVDPMVSKSGLDLMSGAYLDGVDPRTELASPLFAADFGDLPPVCIEVGEYEVLIDDATGLADRMRESGVAVTLKVWPELIHVFQAFPGSLIPEADQSIDAVGAFIAGHLGLVGTTV